MHVINAGSEEREERRMGATAQLMSDFQMSRVPRSQSRLHCRGCHRPGPPAGGGAARAAAPAGGSKPDSGSYPAGGAGASWRAVPEPQEPRNRDQDSEAH